MKTRAMRQAMKRRNAIEPIIGHLKSDTRLGRNYLKGTLGDKLNALLSGIGHNLRIILRKLKIFWLRIILLFGMIDILDLAPAARLFKIVGYSGSTI